MMLYSILNLFVKYEQDEADMLSKVEDWWKSEENPHRNNPFSDMTLPVQHQNEIYRGISAQGYHLPIFMSSRFFIKSNPNQFDFMVFDMYHGNEIQLQLKNLSGFQLDSLTISTIKFIHEKTPRFAICVLLGISETYLCVFEIDTENAKLIIHQLFDPEVPNRPFHFEPRTKRAYFPLVLLDQQELLAEDISNHLFCIFNHSRQYTKEFKLKFLKDGVPTIISQTDIGVGPWWRCSGIVNQKAYTFENKNHDELKVIDLRSPRIIGQDPRTIVKIENFDRSYKYRSPNISYFYDNFMYRLYHNNDSYIEIAVIDLETISWARVYRFQTSSVGYAYNFVVDGNELMVVCQKDPRFIPRSTKIQTNLLFPIRQPLSLTKLTFFAVRRLDVKYPRFSLSFEKLNLPTSVKPLSNFKKSESFQNDDFKRFCLRKNQSDFVSNIFNSYCSIM